MKKNGIRMPVSDRIFNVIIHILLILAVIVTFYPIFFVVIASVSDPIYVNSGTFLLYPKGFTLLGYTRVFDDARIWSGYLNTIIYAVFGTLLGLFCSLLAGYALSRKDLPGRNIIMAIMVFTMYFSGGLIPFYMVVKNLGLTNTRILMVILGSVSVYNIILIRSFCSMTIPVELQEAAFIDGCSNQRFFVSVVLPLSKAIIAVIGLYLAVGYWNAFFNPMIFLTDRSKFPLQLYLREILLTAKTSDAGSNSDPEAAVRLEIMIGVIKYGVIVVSTIPIICVYPFIQKYFVKGVMIGSIKG
ncbi:sugar ABC transporter permease [Spirochaetia bacterium]|nr:sugar ABC transporter permease [Spirochaetia bacterium]